MDKQTENAKHVLYSILYGILGMGVIFSLLNRIPSLEDLIQIMGVILLFYASAIAIISVD